MFLDGCLDNLLGWDHDAQIGYVEVVAGEHYADDVLPDVVDVAFDGGKDNLSGR